MIIGMLENGGMGKIQSIFPCEGSAFDRLTECTNLDGRQFYCTDASPQKGRGGEKCFIPKFIKGKFSTAFRKNHTWPLSRYAVDLLSS